MLDELPLKHHLLKIPSSQIRLATRNSNLIKTHPRTPHRIYRSPTELSCSIAKAALHDLVLGEAAGWLGFHGHGIVVRSWGLVLDEAETEWASTVLVTGELGDGSLGVLNSVEANDTGSAGTSVWLVLNLGLLDLSDGGEELDEILVAGGPWKLK